MNILEFIGLSPVRLYPVQRIILKLIYGIPLKEEKFFQVYWDIADAEKTWYSEKSYVEEAVQEGRCRLVPNSSKFVFHLGRKGGKTFLNSCIITYEDDVTGNTSSEVDLFEQSQMMGLFNSPDVMVDSDTGAPFAKTVVFDSTTDCTEETYKILLGLEKPDPEALRRYRQSQGLCPNCGLSGRLDFSGGAICPLHGLYQMITEKVPDPENSNRTLIFFGDRDHYEDYAGYHFFESLLEDPTFTKLEAPTWHMCSENCAEILRQQWNSTTSPEVFLQTFGVKIPN
jgi:hypothetical protein